MTMMVYHSVISFRLSPSLCLPAVRSPTESAGIDRSESMLKSKDLFEDLEWSRPTALN